MASAFFVCKRREKIYGAGKIRQAKQGRRPAGEPAGAGERAEFPQRKIRPKWRYTRKKYFGKKSVFLTLSFGSIRAAVSEILGGSGGENRYLIMDGGQQYLKAERGRFV